MERTRRDFLQDCFAAGTICLGLCGCGGGNGREQGLGGRDPGGEASMGAAPDYVELERSGELRRREEALWEILGACRLCPRRCGVDRLAGEEGVCSTGAGFKVASHGPHFGEEAPLVGRMGSGTIFFSDCNLLCVYCQNWEINHRGDGAATTHARLARMMLNVQERGCHNLNLVTPTHLVPHIVKALRIAIGDGLRLPLVYNTGGYDALETIRLLDGVVDIYLPDFKYQDEEIAAGFSRGAPEYPRHAAAAIQEMHRQVGLLRMEGGVARRGLMIRHLVLPENLAGTDRFVRWVAESLDPGTYVNLMAQYRPMYRADRHPPLDRRVTRAEFEQAVAWAKEAGLTNLST